MLARLLRLLILVQVLVGTGLGYLLYQFASASPWSMLAGAVLLPVLSTVLLIVVSTVVSRSEENALLWWRSVFGEFWASVHFFLLRQPWTQDAPTALAAIGPQARLPVVLVHGYLCNHRIWNDMANALRARGHTVLAVNLEPIFTSIDNYAPLVEAAVAGLCRTTGSSKVALVGHSMGGLAIRAWMRAHGSQKVARILTLGTPHAGTHIARYTRTPNGLQMAWQSPWLAELSASESETNRTLIRIALTQHDNIVYPQQAQALPGVQPTVFKGIGHLQMCLDPLVIAWVRDQLAEPFADPRGA